MRFLRIILIISIFIIAINATACDMIAMISEYGYNIPCFMQDVPDTLGLKQAIYDSSLGDFSTVYDYFVFMGKYSRATKNNDGYGWAYYKDGQHTIPEIDSLRFYQTGTFTFYKVYPDSEAHEWRQELHAAYDSIRNLDSQAVIVLGHDRNSSSANTPGSHPFWFNLDEDGDDEIDRTFTFQHNGDCTPIKDDLANFLLAQDSTWFQQHPLNWTHLYANPDTLDPSVVIDSELLFHFIMWHIIDNDNNVIDGITAALDMLGVFPDENRIFPYTINFILSDGGALYVFRNSPINGGIANLQYKEFDDGIIGVKTRNNSSYTNVERYSLVHIERTGDISTILFYSTDTAGSYTDETPIDFVCYQNYPNPFNPETTISFQIPQTSKVLKTFEVYLRIYDISGKLVKTLIDKPMESGYHSVVWDGKDQRGKEVGSGVYFYKIDVAARGHDPLFSETKKMLLLK